MQLIFFQTFSKRNIGGYLFSSMIGSERNNLDRLQQQRRCRSRLDTEDMVKIVLKTIGLPASICGRTSRTTTFVRTLYTNSSFVESRPHLRLPRLRPRPGFDNHSRAGGFARRSIRAGVWVRLLRGTVLSLRARRGGGHGHGDGVDNACAVVRGWVQDVVDGAGVAGGADPRGELPALVISK